MQRTRYFADTAPGECQLNFHVDSDVESIQRRFLGTGTPGVQTGLIVVPNLSSLPPKINIGPGTGFTPDGERINVAALISGQALASTAVGDENYVSLVYAEIEDTPLQERYTPVQHDTLVHESYTVEVLVAADWAALTTAEREVRLLLAIVTAKGPATYLTSADIENAVLPGVGVFSSQPVYITGVLVTGIDQTTPSGIGTMSFSPLASPPLMTWLAPGDTGTPTSVPITGFGAFTLPSPNGKTIRIYVTYSSLPLIVATDYLSVNQLYSPDIPILTARDESHRAMIGTGYPTVQNPHGTSLADLGVSEVGLVKEHQDLMHSNGIYRESAAGVLAATPGAAGSGTPPFTNDYLILTQPTGVDCYWVNGKKLIAVSPTISFDDALTQLYLYETYVSDLGAAAKHSRATTPATRKVTGVRIIAMGEEVIAGTYDLWYSRTGDSLSIRWNNGPIQTFTVYPAIPGRTWRVLEGEDGGRVTVFIDDDKLPASGTSDTDVWTVIDPLDRTTCLILQQVAFDGEENVAGEQIRSDFITDLRVFGTLGPDAGADTLDRQYEENMWAQRKYSDGVLWGLDITNASAVVSWEYGEALVGGKKYRLANGVTPNLTPLGNGSWYVYVGEDGTVQWSLTNPSVLVSDRYPTKRLPYALLATVVVSGGAYVSITISRKAPDFVAGDIYQQGTYRYLRNTQCYPHTSGCGLFRDGMVGPNYKVQEATAPDWSTCQDRFGSNSNGGFWGCHPGAGYGVTGYGTVAGGGGVQGLGYRAGVLGCQCGCDSGWGVYGYARNACGCCSGYGGYFYAPFAGGYGVFGCGYSVGGQFIASDTTGIHYALYGCSCGCAGSFGVFGRSGYGGVLGCGTSMGVYGISDGGGYGVYGTSLTGYGGYFCASGAGGVGLCGESQCYHGIIGVAHGNSGAVYGVYGCSRISANGTGGYFLGSQNGARALGDVCGIDVYGGSYGGVFCLCCATSGIAVSAYAQTGCGIGVEAFGFNYGVDGYAYGATIGCGACPTWGVRGYAYGTGATAYGVYGSAEQSWSGIGVRGDGLHVGVFGCATANCPACTQSIGVVGRACEVTVCSIGVCGYGYCGVVGYGNSYGVFGCAPGTGAIGVVGCAEGGGASYGGWFGACGASAMAVKGTNVNGTAGCFVSTNYYGLWVESAYCHAIIGRALYGAMIGVAGISCVNSGFGVCGLGSGAPGACPAVGVFGRSENTDITCSNCAGIFVAPYCGGIGASASGYNVGVAGYSSGEVAGTGVYGDATVSGKTGGRGVFGAGNCYGVYGRAYCNSGIGVYGISTNPGGIGGCFEGCLVGVCGYTACAGAWVCGVAGYAPGTGGIGVFGCGGCAGGWFCSADIGIKAEGTNYAGYFVGNVYASECVCAGHRFFACGSGGTSVNCAICTSGGVKTMCFCGGILVGIDA